MHVHRPAAESLPVMVIGLIGSFRTLPIAHSGLVQCIQTMMADPFEVRMRFTSQLQHLNASVTSAQKAANYALRYRDMDEDLHSCILEQLERVRASETAGVEGIG